MRYAHDFWNKPLNHFDKDIFSSNIFSIYLYDGMTMGILQVLFFSVTYFQLEDKVEKGQEDFDKISKNIRKELARFDKQRFKDFKNTIIHYLEGLMNSQQQVSVD